MAVYPGTPDLFVDLNASGGTNGVFEVRDNGGATLLSLPSSGAGAGTLMLSGDLLFQATSTPKSVEATSGTLSLVGSAVRVGDGLNTLEIDYDGGSSEMSISTTSKVAVVGDEIRLTGSGSGPGSALVRIQDGSTSPREDRLIVSQDTTAGEVVIEAASIPSPLALRLAAAPGADITLDGPTRVLDTLTVNAGGVTVQRGNLNIDDGQIRIVDTEGAITLHSTSAGQSFQWRATATGTLQLSKDDGTGLTEVLTFSRYPDGGSWVTEISGPPSSGALPEEVAIVADNALTLQATDTVSLKQSANDAGINLYADSGPRAFLYAGDPTTANPGIITLGVNSVGRLRFGRFRPSVPNPDDRFVVEATGLLRVYPDTSTGSPGADAILTMDAVTTPGEAVLTVGPAITGTGIRGRVVAGWDGVSAPGLVVLEADDGTPVYLSLWAVSGGHALTASLSVPTSASSGSQVGPVLT